MSSIHIFATISFSDETSDDDFDVEWENDFLDNKGSNAFAFEPEYPEHEIEERLTAYLREREHDGGDEPLIIEQSDENWCTCENCVHVPNIPERLCFQSTSEEIIGGKIDNKKCISLTDAFHDVCLNKNVLETALGTWREFTDEELGISNKSYRFIAYRQFISWIFGWIGEDARKVIPSCGVNKIRMEFPAPDNIYIGYKDSSL